APMAAEVTFDPATRRASFEQTSVLMPASPYTCPGKPESALPSLSSAMFCAAPVHAVYDGSNDWVATAGFGSVPDELAKATPAETAAALFESLRGQAYADHDTTVANRGSETVQLAGRPAAVQLGDLRYRVPGVPSSYDRLFVAVLPLPTGGYVAYLSGRPNDAPASTLDALNESINSLRIG
ncbi:MAG: hypothetical protein L0H41_07330, partial [Microlunatus sp.]|nr:hypothetical protein [Microlunatus sp.]MDN5771569.1 hypothetical protein [Microlunatus sp.]